MKKIILVSGKLRSGKNQFSEYVKEYLEQKDIVVACDLFARGVKDGAREDFKEIYEHINTVIDDVLKDMSYLPEKPNADDKIIEKLESLKTIPDNFYENKTDLTRKILQNYGTNIFRARVDNDYWVKDTVKRLTANPADVIILTDVRFPNEIEYVAQFFDVVSIRIERDIKREKNFNEHESEKALDGYEHFDSTLMNNSTLDYLEKQAHIIANKYV